MLQNRMCAVINPEFQLESPFRLFDKIISNIFVTLKDKLDVKTKRVKPLILDYLKKHKMISTSELAEVIELSYEETFYVLKQLEKEKLIVIS